MSPKIVHGTNADITEFPFQVALFQPGTAPKDTQFCGGVITGPRTVLTAAHCLFDFTRADQVSHPDDIEIFAGSSDLTDASATATLATVAKTTFDPQYDPTTNDFDLGVITLAADLYPPGSPPPLDGTHNIAPITPLTDDTAFEASLTAHDDAVVTGWGDTQPQPGSTPTPSTDLQQATVPLVDTTTCTADYDGDALITARMFCAGDSATPPIADSCQGDSGGPIVVGATPADYKLAGLVDSGEGCAQAGFPGIYDRLSNADFQTFLASDHTQAPEQTGATTMTAGNQPGQTLTCDAGQWDDPLATIEYEFVNTSGAELQPLSPTNTYTIQPTDLGTSIVCQPKVSNAGGYGFGRSSARFVPTPVTPTPPVVPPAPVDGVAPRLTVLSKKCTKRSCTITVRVRDAAPSSGISKVKATLGFSRKVRCKSRKSGAAKTCTKRAHRALRASAGKNGKFTIVAKHLKPGTGYTISLLPIDKAGNKPQFSTITSVRTKKLHPFFLF